MGKMSKTPEGIVLDKCIKILKKLELIKWITHFERMNVGMIRNMQGYLMRQGTLGMSDLMTFVPCNNECHILFLEVKREDGTGIQSETQKDFENKWVGLHNVGYHIITEAKQIKSLVENIRRKSPNYGKIEEWEFPIDI